MDSSESLEDSALDSLSTSIEKLQRKAKAIGELDSWAIESSGTLPAGRKSDQFISTYLKTITRDENGS